MEWQQQEAHPVQKNVETQQKKRDIQLTAAQRVGQVQGTEEGNMQMGCRVFEMCCNCSDGCEDCEEEVVQQNSNWGGRRKWREKKVE